MERHIALAHPEALQIVGPEGPTWGADQDWYRTFWQQRAGCGPTTASEQLAYVARIRHIPALCPLEILRREPFVDYMEQVWDYVTPGHKGLNKVSMFTDGVERFAASRGVALTARALEVPAGEGRPGLPACLDFVRKGLERDCPVAFLNLDNGEEQRLDKWHWVLITDLAETDGGGACTIADGGKLVSIDLALWHRTAKDLGGFVWLETR